MFDQPNPRLPGRNSDALSQIRSLVAGSDITLVDLGDGAIQISVVFKAPGILSVNQDYVEYSGGSGGSIALYGHGKLTVSDNDLVVYEITGHSTASGQVLTFYFDGQIAGQYTTSAIGSWRFRLEAHIIGASTADTMVISSFQGAGLSACQMHANSLGNQLSIDYVGSKTLEAEFTTGSGFVFMNSFDVYWKQAGSI